MTDTIRMRDQGVVRVAVGAVRQCGALLRRWFKERPLRRVFRNAGVLLGGKSVAALLGLGALALTARALGPELFGTLVLVHTYAQIVTGLTTFQSWQAVIRYGAASLDDERRRDFQGLLRCTLMLDLGSAAAGAAIAVLAAPLVGGWLGWNDEVVSFAILYSAVILFANKATPTGILYLFDRFDILAVQGTVSAGVRLLGATAAFVGGGGLRAFLLVWFASTVAAGLTLLVLGWRELARQGLSRGMRGPLRGVTRPYPGLWKFVWSTNLQSSIGVISGHLGTVTVGAILGPAAAGLYKIASQFANVLAAPAALLRRTVYPELAKLSAQGARRTVRRVVLRAGLVAGSITALAVIVLAVLGGPLIRLVAGAEYEGAHVVLVLLSLAMAIWVFGFALEPVMFAIGRPDILLRVTAILTLVYLPLLVVLLWLMGLVGAGIAGVVNSTIWITVLATIAFRRLSRPGAVASACPPRETAKVAMPPVPKDG